MRIRAKHFETCERIDICITGGVIRDIQPAGDETVDFSAEWVAPALFDLQINGCLGRGFSTPDIDERGVRAIVSECRRHGIGAFLPTLITNSFDILERGMRLLAELCERDAILGRIMPGIHLEGPYLSPEDGPRGAHPKKYIRPPDWDEFRRLQDAANGRIRLVTLAPEWPGSADFIKRLVETDVVVAIGHTAADRDAIRAAVDAGARLSTHLGNGSHAVLPRHDNYIWEQLGEDRLSASLICDGFHLPPCVVKSMVRAKQPERIVLTCDAGNLAGCPPGRYCEWGQEFEVLENGKIVVAGTEFLGGSGVFTEVCVANAVAFAGIPAIEAIRMASSRPRQLLGLSVPGIRSGDPAELLFFDTPQPDRLVWRRLALDEPTTLPPAANRS